MTLLRTVKYRSILALLLLCLSGMVWLQGEHIHTETNNSLGGECLVCHLGTAASIAPEVDIILPEFVELASSNHFLQSVRVATVLRPPVRAPPVVLV